jgi:transcriptional regulator MraZ
MRLFFGSEEVKVDDKGRFAIPARYRNQLSDADQKTFYVMAGLDGELLAIPKTYYETLEGRREPADPMNLQHRLANETYSDVELAEFDVQGRLALPASVRDLFEITGTLVITGSKEWLTIWNKERFLDRKAKERRNQYEAAAQRKLRSVTPENG